MISESVIDWSKSHGESPMILDLSRWAVVGYKDNTGLGRMAADLRNVLGVGRHVVVPSERLITHPLDSRTDVLVHRSDSEESLRKALEGLQGIIFFERPDWHPALLPLARRMGIRTVCVPMWEWFSGELDAWLNCDLFACPTRLTLKVVRAFGWRNAVYLPWCLDLDVLGRRQVQGPARVFVHNAGLVDSDDRKGTFDTIRAFASLHRPDLSLLVNMQRPSALPPMPKNVHVQVGDLRNPADLFRDGEVAVQPSKMEGIGFMVLEPVCCGMPVITSDYPPMNEFVRQPSMLVSTSWRRRRAFAGHWVKQAELAIPRQRQLAEVMQSCTERDLTQISLDNRTWAERSFDRERVRGIWANRLSRLVQHQGSRRRTAMSA